MELVLLGERGDGKQDSCSGMTPCASTPLFLLLSPVVDLDSTLVISQDQEPLVLAYASTSPFVHHLTRRERHPADEFPKDSGEHLKKYYFC